MNDTILTFLITTVVVVTFGGLVIALVFGVLVVAWYGLKPYLRHKRVRKGCDPCLVQPQTCPSSLGRRKELPK